MQSKGERARELFLQGYNCAQSIAGAFHEEMGEEIDEAIKSTSAFGGGMGRMREVCGALTGSFIVLSKVYGYTDPKDNAKKTKLYSYVQQISESFKQVYGSIICREIVGAKSSDTSFVPDIRNAEYYKSRTCADKVFAAADILEKFLKENKD